SAKLPTCAWRCRWPTWCATIFSRAWRAARMTSTGVFPLAPIASRRRWIEGSQQRDKASFRRRTIRFTLSLYSEPLTPAKLKMKYLHTMIRVSDLDQTLDFYCNKLGLVEVKRHDFPEHKFTLVFLTAPEDVASFERGESPAI